MERRSWIRGIIQSIENRGKGSELADLKGVEAAVARAIELQERREQKEEPESKTNHGVLFCENHGSKLDKTDTNKFQEEPEYYEKKEEF